MFFSLDRPVTKYQSFFYCHFNLKMEEDSLASSLFGLKQQQKTLPNIWILVTSRSNETKNKLVFVLVKF
mgnify:CR=1 FL=1